jgi:hypothetical protein
VHEQHGYYTAGGICRHAGIAFSQGLEVPGKSLFLMTTSENLRGSITLDDSSSLRRRRKAASRLILERVGRAFGAMMLETGLFQADAHPGNILVMKGPHPSPAGLLRFLPRMSSALLAQHHSRLISDADQSC